MKKKNRSTCLSRRQQRFGAFMVIHTIGKTVLFFLASSPSFQTMIFFSLQYYIYTIRTIGYLHTRTHITATLVRLLRSYTWRDRGRGTMYNGASTLFFCCNFGTLRQRKKKNETSIFFFHQFAYKLSLREREKLGEWRDPDNEVFTIFTVEKWNIANDRTTAVCLIQEFRHQRPYYYVVLLYPSIQPPHSTPTYFQHILLYHYYY